MKNVAINGFGRIGRLVARILLKEGAKMGVQLVAINDLGPPEQLIHLFKYDSVHGRFNGDVKLDGNCLVIDGVRVDIIQEMDPAKLPWGKYGVDVVVEATGRFSAREKAALHLEAGAKRVVLSAPGKNVDFTTCYGVNHKDFDPAQHFIVSNASCTTNCLAPIAKVLSETFGIENGLMTTIHSYTNDQKILDLPHDDLRRARAAALSMIPTTTGAAKAVAMVLPELKGRLDGMAVRVPTPNVSLVDLVVNLSKDATVEGVVAALETASAGELKGIMSVSHEPLVSCDFNGCDISSVVDAPSMAMIGPRMLKVLAWYDNEWGYSRRLCDLLAFMANA